jgi:hypothetical protein
MKRGTWIGVIILAVLMAGGGYLVGIRSASDGSSETTQESNWLFSQTAEAGSISPNADGTWALTLTGIDPVVLGFTDRPLRDAQVGSVERLVEAWPQMFAESNPNGVVVAHNATGDTNSAVVELIDPKLDGSTMTYTVRVLTNEGGPAEPGVTYNFEQVSVFIDDVSVTSWLCESITDGGAVVDPPGVLNAPIAPEVWRSECQVNGGFPKAQRG